MDPTSTLRRRRSKGTSDGEDATAPSNGQNADAVAQNIRASKLSKMLGLSEEQVQEAIREAQKEAEQGVNYAPPRSKQGVSLTLGADVIFYSCLIGAFLYYLQHDSEGGATRFLTSLFPREMAVFGYGRQDGR
ncbi:hypothetical protein JKP88DRAFT_223946 [Tribonema minus]|uniref:Uncharacterized protein n=1 Tax=Tribonema minus TaxID=303371 RepID=A0A835YU56_9STRA|nr:hypothetical protein JKP88DRAFT_223946 [Tribonema minus]